MATSAFRTALDRYLPTIAQARAERRHHDYRRQLFTEFLRAGFDVKTEEMLLEEHVTGLRVSGFIDLLYQYLIFEFKRDIDAERDDGMRELRAYLSTVERRKPVGILTDGLRFEVYSLEENELRLIDSVNLEGLAQEPEAAYLWFETYLFSARDVEPSPEDIVRRFGSGSVVFAASRAVLHEMLRLSEEAPDVRTKFQQWDRLLAKVYGASVGAEELFIRHTYLALLARVIAYVAIVGRRPSGDDVLGIVDGQAFQRVARNLVEVDFFAWVMADDLAQRTRDLLIALTAHLGQYDLTRIGEQDLLQRLYQNLVDPADRHDLGEFYTPDWLAELTLREAGWEPNKSLLDPACGSGTFSFTAIRLLAEAGVEPHDLTRWCLENMAAVDVHPVAVLTTKINFLLALQRYGGLSDYPDAVTLPVWMADSLICREERTRTVSVVVSDEEKFEVNEEIAAHPALDSVINTAEQYATLSSMTDEDAGKGFREWLSQQGLQAFVTYWAANLRLMRRLVQEGRDTIWAYILKNAYRPIFLASRKFDFVVGNPPWLSYRYVRDSGYQAELKRLVLGYGLLKRTDTKLFTQLDTSTLFFVHARRRYLTDGGTLAFVMPRSVLTGAKQHKRFQEQESLVKILDLKDVDVPSETSLKVFGVDSCVLISGEAQSEQPVPAVRLSGTLPRKGIAYAEALPLLHMDTYAYTPIAAAAKASPYLDRVKNGATMIPRSFWFVVTASSGINAVCPRLMTDPSMDARAKDNWKDVHIENEVEAQFLYTTLLTSGFVPFGIRNQHLVILPVHKLPHQARSQTIDSNTAYSYGFPGLGSWLAQAEGAWRERGKSTRMLLSERIDYHGTLTDQEPFAPYRAIYNSIGSHICSCVVDLSDGPPTWRGLRTQGFVAQHKTYYITCRTREEMHFLCAVLNADCADIAIKPHQTRGAYHGERDIERRPFEVLPIPLFDEEDERHLRLAALSEECHKIVAESTLPLDREIGRLRQQVRAALAPQLQEIDGIVAEMLGLPVTQ